MLKTVRLFLFVLALISGVHHAAAQSENINLLELIETLETELEALKASAKNDAYEYLIVSEQLSISHHEHGVALSQSGELAAATKHYQRALELDTANFGPNDPSVLKSANSLATNLNFLGRYSEAENILRSTLVSAGAESSRERNQRWTIVNTLAGSLTGQNRLSEAEQILRETKTQIDLSEIDIDGPLSSLIENNLAHNLYQQKRYAEALVLFRGVVDYHQQQRTENKPEGLLAEHNLASCLIKLQRFQEALNLARETYEQRLLQLGASHPDSLTSLTSLGLAKQGMGQLTDAIADLRLAYDGRQGRLGPTHPDTLESATAMAAALLEEPSKATQALSYVAPTAKIVRDRIASAGTGVGDLASYAREIESSKNLHRILLEAAWQSDRNKSLSDGFEAAQVILNGTTSRAVAQKAANRVADEAGLQSLVAQRQALSQEWHQADQNFLKMSAVSDRNNSKNLDLVAQDRQAISERIEKIDSEIANAAPDYFSLVKPSSLPLAEAQALLKQDEAALLVIPTSYATHLILLTANKVLWRRSDWKQSQIDAAVERLLWDVGANISVDIAKTLEWQSQGDGIYPFDFATAKALYDELIAPIASELPNKKILFIAAAGKLASIPFGIFVEKIPKGPSGDPETLRSAKWFSDQIAQIYIPSLQSLKFLRQHRKGSGLKRATPFLGFGDPILDGKSVTRGGKRGGLSSDLSRIKLDRIFNKVDKTGSVVANSAELMKLARLPGTATELTAIWNALGKPKESLFLAGQATETRVRSTTLDADVISFATHGLLAGEINGMSEPGLIMTPPTQPTSSDDGYLSSSEIAELTISSQWVILSACNTAGGDGEDGEGFSGLAKSFFFAGAPSLLVSHWPVRDAVAARITVIASELANQDSALSPAQSLLMAMREIRKDNGHDTENDTWAHPNAWAPFVIVGDR